MKRIHQLLSLLFVFLWLQPLKANNNESALRIVLLYGYIADDIHNAVFADGTVKNPKEVEELKNFSKTAYPLMDEVLKGFDPKLINVLKKQRDYLSSLLEASTWDAEAIEKAAKTLEEELLVHLKIQTTPKTNPQKAQGKVLYDNNCASCHGVSGKADGPMAKGLIPAPRNFQNEDFWSNTSPFRIYNATVLGIENTSMPSFRFLSDEDLWNIAFYVQGLHLEGTSEHLGFSYLSQKISKIKKYFLQNNIDPKTLASILEGELLDAYLMGFQPLEADLGLIDRALVADIENQFMKARAQTGNLSVFKNELKILEEKLLLAQNILEKEIKKESSFLGEFLTAFIIILREGIEAFLVIMALLGLAFNLKNKRARMLIHAGWVSAIILGLGTYWILYQVMLASNATREILEGISSAIAVVFLFYTGCWLISQAERMKWGHFLKESTKGAISSGNLLSLFFVAFIAVYRESAETILFYLALTNHSSGGSLLGVHLGFLSGVVFLGGFCWCFLKIGNKLPIREFFLVTSVIMVCMSIILAGKSVHEFIEAGYLGSTAIEGFITFDFLGIYPFYETLSAQMLLLMLGVGMSIWIKKKEKNITPNLNSAKA